MKFILNFIVLSLFFVHNSYAQEIDFGSFSSASVTIAKLNPAEELDFGTLVTNGGMTSIPISNSVVLTLTGVRFLDVILDVSAPSHLTLNGAPCALPTCMIPFTLEAAYANLGSDNISQARIISIAANSGQAQFQVLRRNGGAPGPPPTPEFVGFNPAAFNSTAYVYIYGSININTTVDAGTYTTMIDVTVNYD